jgi:hypothetical protein
MLNHVGFAFERRYTALNGNREMLFAAHFGSGKTRLDIPLNLRIGKNAALRDGIDAGLDCTGSSCGYRRGLGLPRKNGGQNQRTEILLHADSRLHPNASACLYLQLLQRNSRWDHRRLQGSFALKQMFEHHPARLLSFAGLYRQVHLLMRAQRRSVFAQ